MQRRLRAVVTMFACFAALPAHPQQPAIPRIGASIEVSIVNLDVVVTDQGGRRVRGLTAADFEVRENGVLQPITNFSAYGGAPAAGAVSVEGPRSAPEPARRAPRTVLVFIERCRLPPYAAKTFFDALKSMLHDAVGPGDRVAIVTWQTSMRMRQDFTANLAAVDAVLDEVAKESVQVSLIDQDEMESRRAAGVPLSSENEFDRRALAHRALDQMRAKTWALKSLLAAMAGSNGRKILLMSSRRYSQYAGAEYFGGDMPSDYKGEFDTARLRKDLIDSANAAGVTIYPLYPPGLGSDHTMIGADQSPSMRADAIGERFGGDNKILINETVALDEVARDTGGTMSWGTTEIAKLLPQIGEDLDTYYSIGYRTPPARGNVRSVDVRTKNRDFRVRSRREYLEKSDEAQMEDRVAASLYGAVPAGAAPAVPIQVSLGAAKKDRKTFRIPLKVRIPIGALTSLPQHDRFEGGFAVYVLTGGSIGVTSDMIRKEQPFTIPAKEIARARKSVFTYELDLVTDGSADRVSVGVMDEISKQYGIARVRIVAAQ